MGTAHLLGLLSLITVLQQVKCWSISIPETVTAVEGSCVVVPCQTEPHHRVIWYQYHIIKYPVVYDEVQPQKVEHQFRGRTKVLGEAAEGNCTLMIDNVNRADNSLRLYVWIDPDSQTTQKFYNQTVTILVERSTPIISTQRQLVEGQNFQADCSIIYSCPFLPPSLQWNIKTFPENHTSVDFSMEVKGQWFYQKALRGVATYLMHNSRISCSAKFRTFTTDSQQMTLDILYKPVTVTLEMEKKVVEGGSIIVECAADSNPPPYTYSWFIRQLDQNKKIDSTQRKMSFSNITRDTSLSCMAHNSFGVQQSIWVDLDVQYPPVILPESLCHLKGNVLKCVCLVEASPDASIDWIIDGNYTLLSSFTSPFTNKKHVVSEEIKITAETQTNVTCTARNPLESNTKLVSTVSLSESSSWLMWFMLLGIALLVGCAVFIYRKYPINRSQNLENNGEQEKRYSLCQRSQNEDTPIGLQRPDRNLEMERLSCVYDNDFLEEMQRSLSPQQHQNSATPLQSKCDIQPPAKVREVSSQNITHFKHKST